MGKGKYKNRNQQQDEEDFGKKKKNIITQQLLMDKSNMDFTEFIPLLPQDLLYPPFNISTSSTKALLKILTDLNYLLYLEPKNFWATVTYNISFQHCLSSCLSQLSARWMNKYLYPSEDQNEQDCDFNYRMAKDLDAYSYIEGLHEVLLKILYRIMLFQEEDPKLNEIYNFGQNTIKKLNVFNTIKLMQLIEIYSSRTQNNSILKTISRNFIRILPNPYKYFIDDLIPHVLKKLEQNNRDMKLISDRQEFGINYSYTRVNPKNLSPGEQELKRKITILMNYISALKFINNTKFVSDEVLDHLYFNSQVNFILENAFYQLDAAYKTWNFQTMQKRLLPMINHIFVEIVDYFVEYFNRVNTRVIKRTYKQNVDAYVRSLERFFVDYGKRYSLGKKGATIRHMTLFKLIMKKIDLIQMFQQLYIDEDQNRAYEFNMEYFIDFKLALEDTYKEDHYIHEDEARQHQIEEQTQSPDDLNINDIDENKNPLERNDVNNQQIEQIDEENSDQLTYFTPQTQDKLEFLVSKKSRQDDYYEQLYLKQRQRFKIEYDDEYDDLVDYDKRPLFMDSASSDSDSQEEVRLQRLVSNENNQKANQIKHIKFEEKLKQKKNQPKYSKVTKQQKQKIADKQSYNEERSEREDGKVKYVSKNTSTEAQQRSKNTSKYTQKQKEPQRQRVNKLQQLLEQQNMPRQGHQDYQEEQQENGNKRGSNQGGRGGQGGHKRRFVPNTTQDNKGYKDKGGNSNKNRQHGNATNQAFGGGKKYKAKY